MKKLSLRIKLILYFIIISGGVWITSSILSWQESKESIDEFFDSYQLLMAKNLSLINWQEIEKSSIKKADYIINNLDNDGDEDDDAIGIAVFNQDGKIIYHDNKNGKLFSFQNYKNGFINQPIGKDKDLWRILWTRSTDKKFIIAVGQELEYREDAAFDMIEETLMPWIIGLSILLIAIIWLISIELRPLKIITDSLKRRASDDLSPLDDSIIHSEIKPLVEAINKQFLHISEMLNKERNFISDSAHELRSPLTALKVQLEVAMLSDDDKPNRQRAYCKLKEGIDRASHLVEQLLTLSKLESKSYNNSLEQSNLEWNEIIKKNIQDYNAFITDKNINLSYQYNGDFHLKEGNNLLCSLMLKNLLDNAVKYSSNNANIQIIQTTDYITISNDSDLINDKDFQNLGNRFFRPRIQQESGSGLGLSIVKRIAKIHNCSIELSNVDKKFVVTIK